MPSGSQLMSGVHYVRQVLIGLAAWTSATLFSGLFVLNLLQIVMRPINGGWIWVNDLSRLAFTWVVMLGAAAAYGKYDHLVVSFVAERLPGPLRATAAIVVRAVELIIAVVLVFAGLVVAENRMAISYTQLGWSTGWAYLAAPVLGAFIVIFGLTSKPRTPTSEEQLHEETTHGSE